MFNVNNCCTFEGRLTKDPVHSTVGQGQNAFSKVLFNIAVDRALTKDQRAAKKAGTLTTPTADFISCVAIGAKADVINQYFKKGKPIKVFCSYQAWSKDDPNNPGQKTYGHIFQVEEIGFPLTDNSGGNGGNSAPAPTANQAPAQTPQFSDDDIPF